MGNNFQDKVDDYIKAKEVEDNIVLRLKEIKEWRVELMNELTAMMDSHGILSVSGTTGKKVSIVHKSYTKVFDFESFRRWCIENGKVDRFFREKVHLGSTKDPGLTQYLKDHPNEAPNGISLENIETLRITKKAANNGFAEAGKSVLEMLEGEK